MANRRNGQSPLRRRLLSNSTLLAYVANGISGLKARDHRFLDTDIRDQFTDSVDLDSALREEYAEESRWDYLLGHKGSDEIIAIEPHSAKTNEITTVIRKRESAKDQLRNHLRADARIAKWLWVASGDVYFSPMETAINRLNQNGIQFVGKRVKAKHLPERKSSPRRNTYRKK